MSDRDPSPGNVPETLTRRSVLTQAAGAAALGAAGLGALSSSGCAATQRSRAGVRRGRIKQSIVHWCFELFGEEWSVERTCEVAVELGCESVELVGPEHFPTLDRHGLVCAIGQIDMSPDPPFLKGFNNPRYHERVIAETRKAIDACADYGYPNVICFTGYKYRDADDPNSGEISPEEGIENCVEGLKQVIDHAERKNINLCLEMLNTRDGSFSDTAVGPLQMKGHPGYQGDDTEYCVEIIKRVGSERMKLLFDIYHVQIMNGDIIRRIHEHKDYIAHIHTAGNPGRHELDGDQEIHYPPTMQALLDIGYEGYVGQEFIPTRDPFDGLRVAVEMCDV